MSTRSIPRHNRAREAVIVALSMVRKGKLESATAALKQVIAEEFNEDLDEVLEELDAAAEASVNAQKKAIAALDNGDVVLSSLQKALAGDFGDEDEDEDSEEDEDDTTEADTLTTQLSPNDAVLDPAPGPDDTVVESSEDEDEDEDEEGEEDETEASRRAVARLAQVQRNKAVVAALRKSK